MTSNAESDFVLLKELAERIKNDPANATWYMYKAYRFGKGDSVSECLKLPDKTKNFLTIVK